MKGHPGTGWCYMDGPSVRCRNCDRHKNTKPWDSCPEEHHRMHAATLTRIAQRNDENRRNVLRHYGGKCACCGFNDLSRRIGHRSFLQIDHINGGGRQHIKANKIHSIYVWLKRNNLPKGFRVLCAGCNAAMEPGASRCIVHERV